MIFKCRYLIISLTTFFPLRPDKPADWEKELEKELQEYDVMPDAEDDPLDDDLEKMLQAYNNNS